MEAEPRKNWLARTAQTLAFWRRGPKALDWQHDVCPLLPSTISIVPASEVSDRRVPVTAPWAQSSLHALGSAAPSLHTAMKSGQYLKIIGPQAALDKSLPFMHDKEGHILGSLVNPETSKISAQVRFEEASRSLNAAATAAGTFQVLSVAASQYYLHQISETLQRVEGKLDDLNGKIESRQYGEIKGALETIREVYNRNVRHIETNGTVDWQPPERTEFWTRMANAEEALRTNCHALERDLDTKVKRIRGTVTEKDGKRTKESYNDHRTVLGELRKLQCSFVVELYLAAVRGMVQWYEVVLAFDAVTWNGLASGRHQSMMDFVRERNAFFGSLQKHYEFILDRPEGAGLWDNAITAGSAVAGALFSPLAGLFAGKSIDEGRAKAFEKDRAQLAAELQDSAGPLVQAMGQFRMMESSVLAPREFYLKPRSVGSKELELVIHPEHE